MKRTKQVQIMVDSVNRMLKANRVINQLNTDVLLFQHLLLKSQTYKGFNWFYQKDLNSDLYFLAGTADQDKLRELDAFIQFY